MQFWRYCTISFPYRSLLQIITEVSKTMKVSNVTLNFIFIELPETHNSFVKIPLVLEIRNVVNLIKPRLLRGYMKMRKYTETFHAAQGYRFQLSFLHQLNCFQNRNLWYFFQTLSAQKRGMAHPYFCLLLLSQRYLSQCFIICSFS